MIEKLKVFMIMLLPLAAVAVTSCQDDPEWKPTWALPLVKEQTISIGDFIGENDVKEVNDRVREKWNDYVNERFGLNSTKDSLNVDSIAYAVLVDTTSTYVIFDAITGAPKLNDSTENLIKANLADDPDRDAKIDQINEFLQAYWSAKNPPVQSSPTAKVRPLAETSSPSSGSYGGDSAVHNLLDAMIHPNDVFITAANLLSAMGKGYIDSINNQIDKILKEANMTDTIAVNFAGYIGEDAAISSLELHLRVTNMLPFNITLGADFINDNGNEAIIKDTTVNGAENTPPTSPFTTTFTTDRKSQLDNIKNATGVRFSVICRKDKDKKITEQDLRELSKKTISFNLRVSIQAPMNKLGFKNF